MSRETDPITIDIPDAIRNLPMWFCWRWATPRDRPRFKMPCQVTGAAASSIDRHTWTTYDKAAEAAFNFEGLAVGFGHWGTPPDDYSIAGIDLDGCLEDGGGLKDWAARVLARVNSYAEFSPSGKGIHILVKVGPAYLPGVKINLSETEHIEFYSTARYFTFTGNHVPGTPDDLQARGAVYEALRAEFEALRPSSQRSRLARSAEKPATAAKASEQRVTLTDAEIVSKASSGPSGEAFARLYSGDLSDYREDHSSADMALAGRLAFWTGKDPEQMDRIFRESGLMRPKWDTRRGLSTYGEQTVEVAIENCEDVYTGGDKSSESFVENLKRKRAAKVAATQVPGKTLKLGNVRDQERGEDKPVHGVKVRPPSEYPESPNYKGRRVSEQADLMSKSAPKPSIPKLKPGEKLSPLGSRIMRDDNVTLWPGTSDGTMTGDLFSSNGRGASAPNGDVRGAHEGGQHVGIPSTPVSVTLSRQTIEDSLVGGKPVPMIISESVRRQLDGNESAKVYARHTIGGPGQRVADILPESAIFTSPVNMAETVNIKQSGLLPTVGDPSGNGEDQLPTKASEYVAQTDVDYSQPEVVEDYVDPTPHVIEEPDAFELTDDGNMARFKAQYAGQLIFTKSAGWMRFDGRVWVKGDEYAIRAAAQVAREIVSNAINDPRLSQERKTALAKHGLNSQSVGRIHAMASLASAHAPFTRYEIDLDRDLMLLNTPSGIVDLRTGELTAHDAARFMTKITNVEYDPDAQSDLWDEVLREATVGKDGLAEFLQRAAGYTLTGETREDAVFFLHGGGGTAKSTIGESFKTAMGTYATSMRSEALTAQGNSGHSDDIARLVGARMVITGEADKADKMRDGLFKRLSGGETIDASRKGKTGFNFVPRFKMWFITNTVPTLNPDDTGIWRRVHKLPFDIKVPKPDKRIRIALINDRHHQRAILAWAVKGAVEWYRSGLGTPSVVLDATEALRRSMDGLADFFDQRCYFNQDPQARLYTSSKDLMSAYVQWANEEGIDGKYHASSKRLGQAAKVRGATDRRTTHERGYWGVIIKDGD